MSRICSPLTLALLLLLCFASNSIAQDAGQPGEFLRWGVGCRALGMGRAFVAVANDASAIYWNPAGLMSLRYPGWWSVMLMGTKLYGGASYNHFATAFSVSRIIPDTVRDFPQRFIRNLSAGVAYTSFVMSDLQERDDLNLPTGREFSDSQSSLAFCLSYGGHCLGHKLGVGLNLKHIDHTLFNDHTSTNSMDLGFKLLPSFGWVSTGLVFQNFNRPAIGFGNAYRDTIPATTRIGACISPRCPKIPWLDAGLVSCDYDASRHKIYIGAEYNWLRISSLPVKTRIGWNNADKAIYFGLSFNELIYRLLPSQLTPYKYVPEIDWSLAFHSEKALSEGAGGRIMGSGVLPLLGSVTLGRKKTDKEWYEEGKELFTGKSNPECCPHEGFESSHFECAIDKATPEDPTGNYKVAARLRLGDITVLEGIDKKKGLIEAVEWYEEAETGEGNRNRKEIDDTLNGRSYLYYIQGLLYSKRYSQAKKVCAQPIIWKNHKCEKTDTVKYLEGGSLLGSGDTARAVGIFSELEEGGFTPALFMIGLVHKEIAQWRDARDFFMKLLQKKAMRPPGILYPEEIVDGSMLDDAQYYIGECWEEIAKNLNGAESQMAKEEAKHAYLKVIIYYPFSHRIIDAKGKLEQFER